jgi:hypothetical protein
MYWHPTSPKPRTKDEVFARHLDQSVHQRQVFRKTRFGQAINRGAYMFSLELAHGRTTSTVSSIPARYESK